MRNSLDASDVVQDANLSRSLKSQKDSSAIQSIVVLEFFIGALLLSFAGVLTKPLAGYVSPLGVAIGRAAVGVPLIFLFRSIHLRRASRPIWLMPVARDKWQWFGIVCLALNAPLFFGGIIYGSTAVAYLISSATPFYMLWYQLFFDETRPPPRDFFFAFLVFLGLALFFSRGLEAGLHVGTFLSLGAGVTFAGFLYAQGTLQARVTTSGEPLAVGTSLFGHLFSLIISLPLLLLLASGDFIPELWTPLAVPPLWAAILVVLIGILVTSLPSWLWARSVPELPRNIVAMTPTLIALWAPLWTLILLGEAWPNKTETAGIVVVHGTVLAACLLKRRR